MEFLRGVQPSAVSIALVLLSLCPLKSWSASDGLAFEEVVLLNVHGLWGGQSLWLRKDGIAIAQEVATLDEKVPRLRERRFRIHLSDTEMAAVRRVLQDHSFLTIRTKDRAGVIDEGDAKIWLRTTAGTNAAVMKWARDKHKEFDAIYERLRKVVDTAKRGETIYSGSYQSDWRPSGFPRWQEIHNLAVKDSRFHQQIEVK